MNVIRRIEVAGGMKRIFSCCRASSRTIWEKFFLEEGSGSSFARAVLGLAGWVFIMVPFALLLMNSLARLQNFQIPPEPFFR